MDDNARIYEEAARKNIDTHIGDVAEDGCDLFSEAYVLAFDGAVEAGAPFELARVIAAQLAMPYCETE